MLRSLLLRQPLLRKLSEALFRLFIPLPFIQRKLAQNLSGLGITYDTGKGELAGKRIPDMELMTANHKTVRLYELLRFPGYTLLLFVAPNILDPKKGTDRSHPLSCRRYAKTSYYFKQWFTRTTRL